MKLIVFDLDFTLWNAGGTWCDHTNPPYTRVNGHVIDSYGSKIHLYSDVRKILAELKSQGYLLAVASRTGAPSWARELMHLLEIDHYFDYQQIYPGSKIAHFRELHKHTGIAYTDMAFFDDEMRNIQEVSSLGVKAVFVKDGVSKPMVFNAIYL